MLRFNWPPKFPETERDYGADWNKYLKGDAILAATWEVPEGLNNLQEAPNGQIRLIRIGGGRAGKKYTIRHHVVTESGQKFTAEFILSVIG